MTIPVLKIKVLPKTVVKGKMDVRFPASVSVISPVLLDRTGGNFSFSLDINALGNYFLSSTSIITPGLLPLPTSTTLGGVKSLAAQAHKFLTQIGTDGTPAQAQPAFTDISGTATIAQGGTGQATASAAFDALAPTTTRGDIIFRNATTNARLAAGTSTYVLTSNGPGADPSWSPPPGASPTTTRGDLIARGASVDTRLALGTSGYALLSNGTDPAWTGFLQSGTGAVTRTWNDKTSERVSVKDFGAKGDTVSVSGATSITSGTAALTVTGASFATTDVGKSIQVPGAGAAGVTLVTTILSRTSATQVTLNTNASTTLSAVTKTVHYYTDDTTAIQAAITYAIASTREIFIPAGIYAYSALNFDHAIGLSVRGEGAWTTSILRCMNTSGSTAACTFRSTFDVTVSKVMFDHSSAGWSGYLVDAQHAPSGFTGDTQGLHFDRCGFSSQGNNLNTAFGLNLNQATIVTVSGCKFVSLVRPINGQATGGASYSNVVRVINCQFAANTGYCFNYPGQGWHVEGCNFQACADGAQRIVFSDSTVTWLSLTFINCLAYDATAAGTSYFLLDQGQGLTVIGGMYGGRSDLGTSTWLNATGIVQGVHCAGVYWSLFSPVFNAAVAGNKAWDVDRGNITKTCATFSSGGANISPALTSTYIAVIP